jgi:hypothetical protein
VATFWSPWLRNSSSGVVGRAGVGGLVIDSMLCRSLVPAGTCSMAVSGGGGGIVDGPATGGSTSMGVCVSSLPSPPKPLGSSPMLSTQ